MRGLVLALALLPAAAYAESYALIIGSNQSQSGEAPLRFADDDATKYARFLEQVTDKTALHVAPDAATARLYPGLLTNARAPTRREILRSVQRFAKAAKQSEDPAELFFVFVGHGNLDEDGGGYLNLSNSQNGRFTREDLFREVFDRPEFEKVHVIIDACNAFFVVAGRGAEKTSDSAFNNMLLRGSLQPYPHVGVLLSTSGAQQAFEWSRVGGGVFSHALRSALSGAADIDADGKLTYGETHAFVLSALQGIEDPKLRQQVFIRAPKQAPLAPLVDLERSRFSHFLRIDQPGRLTLESPRDVVVDAYRSDAYVIALVDEGPYYAKIGARAYEVERSSGRRAKLKLQQGDRPAARGKSDAALRAGLFSYAFDLSYYRAFSAMAGYPVIQATKSKGAWQQTQTPVSIVLQTVLGSAIIEGGGPAFGLSLHALIPLSPYLGLTGGLAFDHHQASGLTFQPRVLQFSIPLGVEGRLPLAEQWALFGYGQLGYAFVAVRSGSENQTLNSSEPAGFVMRGGAGARFSTDHFGVDAGLGVRTLSARVGEGRGFFTGVEARVSVIGRLPW